MASVIPYLVSPGSIKNALEKIRTAATPERVSGDFVNTKLQIKGGTGAAIPSYLKKIGFVNSDGSPTEIYKRFRNKSSSGAAVAEAIKIGYKPLAEINEYFYDLSDKELLGIILQITGAAEDDQVAKLILSTFKALRSFADFNEAEVEVQDDESPNPINPPALNYDNSSTRRNDHKLNLSYTINLNLPASSDQAVFNAIFKSLKEHLISDNE